MRYQRILRRLVPCAAAVVLMPAAATAQTTGQPAPTRNTPAVVAAPVPESTPALAPTPRRAPATFSWTGFYVGGNVDYVQTDAATTFDPLPSAAQFINLMPTTLHPDPTGAAIRIQGGANQQMGHFVIGGEGDISFANPDGFVDVTPIIQNNGSPFPGTGALHAGMSTDWIITGRVRAGVVFGRVLVYGAGGIAVGSVNYYAETDFRPAGTTDYLADFVKTKTGWTAGGGAEIRINRHLSARGEYRYTDLGSESRTVDPVPALPPFQVAYTWQTKLQSYSGGLVIHF